MALWPIVTTPVGRHNRIRPNQGEQPYLYVAADPVDEADPTGRKAGVWALLDFRAGGYFALLLSPPDVPKPRKCKVELRYREVTSALNKLMTYNHAFFKVTEGNQTDYYEGGPEYDKPSHWRGWGYVIPRSYPVHDPSELIASEEQCKVKDCIERKAKSLRIYNLYHPVSGPNSNTWAHRLATACGITKCDLPGYGDFLTGWDWTAPPLPPLLPWIP